MMNELVIASSSCYRTQASMECKGFEDTRGWTFYESLEEAKANLGKPGAPAQQLAEVA